jgi:hypothetical protein
MTERQVPLTPAQSARLVSAQALESAATRHARLVAAEILREAEVGSAQLLRVEAHDEGLFLVVKVEG